MRLLSSAFLLPALLASPFLFAAQPPPRSLTFDSDDLGAVPAGFAFALAGKGPEGEWEIERDPGQPANHVLTQTSSDSTEDRFPLAIVAEGAWKDVSLEVRARPVSGKVDQGFGLVWRFRDPDDYYVARCDAGGNGCAVDRVVKGERQELGSKKVEVSSNAWHTLRVEADGDRFAVWLDDHKVLKAKDGTFEGAGQVGLWTKSDSVVQFDDLTIEGR